MGCVYKEWEFHGILCVWDCNGMYIYIYVYIYSTGLHVYGIYGLLMGSWNIYEYLYIYIYIPMNTYGSLKPNHQCFFPTCQVRVVSFRSSTPPAFRVPPASSSSSPRPPRPPRPTAIRDPQRSLPDLNHDHPRPVFPAGPQPRPSTPSVPCRTSTMTIHAQCSLPDLNHDHPRPVFPAGPQPRPSAPSVPCRTSTTTIRAQCSLPDLM